MKLDHQNITFDPFWALNPHFYGIFAIVAFWCFRLPSFESLKDPKIPKGSQKVKIYQKWPQRAQKGLKWVPKGLHWCHFCSLFIVKVVHLANNIKKGSKRSKMGPKGSKKGPKGSEKGPKKTPFLTFLEPFYSKNLSYEVVFVAFAA